MINEKGFTLIEMMIVLLVISVLLIITIPNVTNHNANINTKGCEAFQNMVEAQVQAFMLDKERMPTSIDELKEEGYLKGTKCPDGSEVFLDDKGNALKKKETPTDG